MQCTFSNKNSGTHQIILSGKFTFEDHQAFRSIVDLVGQKGTQAIDINFSAVEFIDSAGLGMLLLLRDKCVRNNVTLVLSGAQGQVEKIFAVSRFDQLFTLRS